MTELREGTHPAKKPYKHFKPQNRLHLRRVKAVPNRLESITMQVAYVRVWKIQRRPQQTGNLYFQCVETGQNVVVTCIPWAGVAFTTTLSQLAPCIANALYIFGLAAGRSTLSTVQRYFVDKVFDRTEIVGVLSRYKLTDCQFRVFANEIVIVRNKSMIFIDVAQSFVLIFGPPFTLLQSAIFLNGLLAMVVPKVRI